MSHYDGGKKETNLVASSTFDFVRVIADRASRRISLLNFVAAIKQALINIGFLTTDDLPVAVSQLRFYTEKTSNYGLLTTDSVLGVDSTGADVDINLMLATDVFDVPTAKGQLFTINNIGTGGNQVTINTNGSDLIIFDGSGGQASLILEDGAFVTIYAKSTTRWILI